MSSFSSRGRAEEMSLHSRTPPKHSPRAAWVAAWLSLDEVWMRSAGMPASTRREDVMSRLPIEVVHVSVEAVAAQHGLDERERVGAGRIRRAGAREDVG